MGFGPSSRRKPRSGGTTASAGTTAGAAPTSSRTSVRGGSGC